MDKEWVLWQGKWFTEDELYGEEKDDRREDKTNQKENQ